MKKEKIQAYILPETKIKIVNEAKKQKRSQSQMAGILLDKAINDIK